jgi:hypothetical protein
VIMFATINNYVGYPPQAYRVLYLLCFYTLLSFQLSAPVVKNAGSPAVLIGDNRQDLNLHTAPEFTLADVVITLRLS